MNKDFFENKVQKLFEVPSYLYLLIVTCPLWWVCQRLLTPTLFLVSKACGIDLD
jgi:hypothetical protein